MSSCILESLGRKESKNKNKTHLLFLFLFSAPPPVSFLLGASVFVYRLVLPSYLTQKKRKTCQSSLSLHTPRGHVRTHDKVSTCKLGRDPSPETRPCQNLDLTALRRVKKIIFCCLSHSVYNILFW